MHQIYVKKIHNANALMEGLLLLIKME
jgi:hypothetical protein